MANSVKSTCKVPKSHYLLLDTGRHQGRKENEKICILQLLIDYITDFPDMLNAFFIEW